MNLFLGYIGVLNTIILSPILVWFFMSHYSNNSSNNDNDYSDNDNGGNPQVITWYIFLCLAIKGLFDNVLSDYLWAKGIVLTTATVASVGLGLTIPLALLSDVFIIKRADVWTLQGVLGAVLVLSGFIFVNIGEDDREQDETEDPLVEFSESIDHISLS
jgi:solute carrier family 35 protein F5